MVILSPSLVLRLSVAFDQVDHSFPLDTLSSFSLASHTLLVSLLLHGFIHFSPIILFCFVFRGGGGKKIIFILHLFYKYIEEACNAASTGCNPGPQVCTLLCSWSYNSRTFHPAFTVYYVLSCSVVSDYL